MVKLFSICLLLVVVSTRLACTTSDCPYHKCTKCMDLGQVHNVILGIRCDDVCPYSVHHSLKTAINNNEIDV